MGPSLKVTVPVGIPAELVAVTVKVTGFERKADPADETTLMLGAGFVAVAVPDNAMVCVA